MKDLNDIERRLHQRAQQHNVEVDTDELWGQVEPHLPSKKKRRLFIFFWFMTGLIIMTGSAMYFYDGGSYYSNSEVKVESLSIVKPIEQEPITQFNTENQQLVIEEGHDIKVTDSAVVPKNLISTDIKNDSNLSETTTTANASIINSRNSAEIEKTPKMALSLTNVIDKEGTQLDDVDMVEHRTTTISENDPSPTFDENMEMNETANYIKSSLELQRLFQLPIDLLHNSLDVHLYPLMRKRMPWEDPTYSWDLIITGGLSNNQVQLAARSGDAIDQVRRRQNAERSLASWHINGRLSYQLSADWSVGVGLRYAQLFRDSYASITSIEQITLDNVVIETIIGPNGIENKTGTAQVTLETITDVTRINQFAQLNTELVLLRRVAMNTIDINIGLGLGYNISYQRSGYIHPTDTQEYDLSTDDNDWYRSGAGFSGLLEVGLRLPVTDRLGLTMMGTYNRPFSTATTSGYDITERHAQWHLGLGICYKL